MTIKGYSEKGFSLVEVLVALVIISLVFMAVMASFSKSIPVSSEARHRFTAVNLARQKIESIRYLDQSIHDRTSEVWTAVFATTNEPQEINGFLYTTQLSLITSGLPEDISTNNDYIPIRATVTWTEQGRSRSVTLNTYFVRTQ